MSTFSQFFNSSSGGDGVNPGDDFFGYSASKYYAPSLTSNNAVSAAIDANRVWYVPFYCREAHTFTGISLYQSNAAPTGNARLGVYSNSAGLPSTLVIDAGAVAFPGSTGIRTAATSIALSARTAYWLAMVADAALTMHVMTSTADSLPSVTRSMVNLGAFSPSYVAINGSGGACYAAFTYGALPSTPTAPTADSSNNPPLIFLKG